MKTARPNPAALAALVLAAALAASACAERGEQMATQPVEVEGLDNPQRLLELAQGVTLGDPNAPVTIMEFADYSCPHCREFEERIRPRIDLAYLQPGHAKLVFHDFPLGSFPHSFLAARAARCAGDQERYWEYHQVLFRNQPGWSMASAAPVRDFLAYADEVGLDRSTFEGCLRSERHADVVTANRRLAVELNLGGTPAVLVGRVGDPLPRRLPDPNWEPIAEAVDAMLAQQQGAGTP